MAKKPLLAATFRPFVLKWGDLGSAWGLGRSAAQVHGLLLVADGPLSADEIASALSIARSNVSACVKELKSAELIETTRALGDRKERFVALSDGMTTLGRLAAYRKARELDPALAALKAAPKTGEAGKRLADLGAAVSAAEAWASALADLPAEETAAILNAGPSAPKKKKKKK